jgi:hypothetical protein
MTTDERPKIGEGDLTPSRPTRLLTGTALCLLDLAQTARAIAQAIDRGDSATRAAFGRQVVDLGREFVQLGRALAEEGEGKI